MDWFARVWHAVVTAISSLAPAATGVGVIIALQQWIASIRLRRRELRWKQAEQGKRLFDEIIANPESARALLMIDSKERTYLREAGAIHLTHHSVLAALSADHPTEDQLFVRDAFDQLFYLLDRARQFRDAGLVKDADVRIPASYYAGRMARRGAKGTYEAYLASTGYNDLLTFLTRLPGWDAHGSTAPSGATAALSN